MLNLIGVAKLLSSRNNTKSSAVVFIALLTLSAAVAVTPAFAQKTYTAVPDRDTGTVVGVSPKLVGLTQPVLINIMTYPAPSGPTYFAQGSFISELINGLNGISVTITKPDGTKETFMPIDETLEHVGIKIPGLAQIVGSLQFQYTPDQVGNWSVTASFAGTTYTTDKQYANLNLSVYYKPSSTRVAETFTVQEDIVLAGILNGWPWSPLPTAYWTNPVSTNNREWAAISGDWTQPGYDAGITNYNPYSKAPSSPHILWAKQVSLGGLPGGVWGSLPNSGGGGAATVVLEGKIYQGGTSGFDCIDLRTGQKLWSAPGSVTLAQRIDPAYQTATQVNEGAIAAWLWGIGSSAWTRYDPMSGNVLQTITGVPSPSTILGQTRLPDTRFTEADPIIWVTQFGGWNTTLPLKYAFENLIKWDFSKLTTTIGFNQVTSNNWTDGIVWNVSIRQPDGVGIGDGRTSIRVYPFPEAGVVMVRSHDDEQIAMGFDYNTGQYLWRNDKMILDIGLGREAFGPNGPYVVIDGATQNFVAYNVKTGQEQWRASCGELPWSILPTMDSILNIEDGVWYAASYDGHVYAYDYQSGDVIWQSDYYGAEDESIYGTQPFGGGMAGADGKLYFSTATVYSLMPRTRFHALVAIDEATGNYIWKLPIGAQPKAIADGYLVATDTDNGMQYCIGKGQTATTVAAGPAVGSGVTIQGTVMDMSPGAPNTPAVSDADMSVWMDYLYGQNATLLNSPPALHGVEVELRALNSDGTVVDLGTVSTDSAGHFVKTWVPSSEGTYTIYAAFAGSDSYWSSSEETGLSVGPAAEIPSQQPAAEAPDYTLLLYAILVVGIIAIMLALVIIFRKH